MVTQAMKRTRKRRKTSKTKYKYQENPLKVLFPAGELRKNDAANDRRHKDGCDDDERPGIACIRAADRMG